MKNQNIKYKNYDVNLFDFYMYWNDVKVAINND